MFRARRGQMLPLAAVFLSWMSGPTHVGFAQAPITLQVAGRANANVSIAARDSFTAAVWSASVANGPTDVFAAVSRDGGATFSAPVRVNSTPGQVNVNGEQPPRIALAPRQGSSTPAIVIVWSAKGSNGTVLLHARSDDGGATFSRSAVVPGAEAPGNRGWEGVTVDNRGRVGVVWLDHRELAKGGETMATTHHHTSQDAPAAAAVKMDGVAMAQKSRLYYAVIGDASSVRGLTGGVCYCCKTAVATSPSGLVALAWRHVYPGNLRDIAFSISKDGGKTFAAPIRVSEDKWQLEGCPDDGPSMVFDSNNAVHIVWPTLVEGPPGGRPTIGLFYASSKDGRAFGARTRIPTEGVPHHPQMALASNGSMAVAWDELVDSNRRIAFAMIGSAKGGGATFSRQVLSGSDPALYPIVASSGGQFLTAWTSGQPATSVIRIEKR